MQVRGKREQKSGDERKLTEIEHDERRDCAIF